MRRATSAPSAERGSDFRMKRFGDVMQSQQKPKLETSRLKRGRANSFDCPPSPSADSGFRGHGNPSSISGSLRRARSNSSFLSTSTNVSRDDSKEVYPLVGPVPKASERKRPPPPPISSEPNSEYLMLSKLFASPSSSTYDLRDAIPVPVTITVQAPQDSPRRLEPSLDAVYDAKGEETSPAASVQSLKLAGSNSKTNLTNEAHTTSPTGELQSKKEGKSRTAPKPSPIAQFFRKLLCLA
jgi:hypothetical protein